MQTTSTKYHESDLSFENDNLMTKQSFKDECCINNIMKRYEKTGILPENYSTPQYGDFTDIPDFQTMQNMVMEAQSNFMTLPAELRAQFNNNVADFMDFVSNPANQEQLYEMGLAERPHPISEPQKQTTKTASDAAIHSASDASKQSS